jgi:hypothetical protein
VAPPGGLPWNCHSEPYQQPTLQIGAAASWLNTTLDLGEAGRTDLEMDSLSLSAGFPLNPRWTLRLGAGVVYGGELRTEPGDLHEFDNGFLGAVMLERENPLQDSFLDQLDYSISLSGVFASTLDTASDIDGDYTAFDLRLGVRAVKRVSTGSVGYLAGRVFGGPVKWEIGDAEETGGDVHHYQLALGYAIQVGKAGIFAEWSALGEQGFTGGISTVW